MPPMPRGLRGIRVRDHGSLALCPGDPPSAGMVWGVEVEVHVVATLPGFHPASQLVDPVSAALAASVTSPARQGRPCEARTVTATPAERTPDRGPGSPPPALPTAPDTLRLSSAALPGCPWKVLRLCPVVVLCGSPFGGLQTEAGFVRKLRPQSSQARGPPPSLSAGFPHSGPCRPLRFGCHPASLPASQRRTGAGGGGQPCSPWERILWFWLYVCLGFFVCVFFPSEFRFQTGNWSSHALQSRIHVIVEGRLCCAQTGPAPLPLWCQCPRPWLPPHLPPLASLTDPT